LLKPISAALTLGSGSEGERSHRPLKVGALFGFCLGYLLNLVFPTSRRVCHGVCRGAYLGNVLRAADRGHRPFEISRNYSMLLPLLFAAIFSAWIVHRRKVHTFNPNQRNRFDYFSISP
jgi:H+/Cl- antiporter ClcA